MKPRHQRDIILAVRDHWLHQYINNPDDKVLGWDARRTFGSVRRALLKLDLQTCRPTDVDSALGVTGWADNKCDECGNSFPLVFHFGEEPGYEAKFWRMCKTCLQKAVDVYASIEPKP